MKTVIGVMCASVLMASTALAQAPAAPAAGAGGQKVPLSEGLRRSYNTLKMNLTETAQKFDDATYGYTPSPDIRAFGAQLAHVATEEVHHRVRGRSSRELGPLADDARRWACHLG